MNHCRLSFRSVIVVILLAVAFPAQPGFAQLARFEKSRMWTSQSGKFKKEAQLVSCNNESVELKFSDGSTRKLKPSVLSSMDREFLREYRDALFKKVKSDAQDLILTTQQAELYQDFLARSFLSAENRMWLESELKKINTQIESDQLVILPFGTVSETELKKRKARSSKMVSDWLEEADKQKSLEDQTQLREAIKFDPTSTEASLCLAMIYEVHDNKPETAQRHLDEAIRRGMKYLSIANDTDRANLVAAINNLAVSNARISRVSKAIRLWDQANVVSEFSLPAAANHNIAKLVRAISAGNSGIHAKRAEARNLDRFATKTSAAGSAGGWQYIVPLDVDGNRRDNLKVVVSKFSTINGGTIHDSRCVNCGGATRVRCPNKGCKGGVVKEKVFGRRIVTFPDGTRQDLGTELKGYKSVPCTTCRGQGSLPCRCCRDGRQNN